MPTYHQFPCSNCDHQFELTTTQAGQLLECPECLSTTDAPKLGVLKQLPTVGGVSPKQPTIRNGSIGWKRYLFAFGLVIAVAAGVSGGALYWYSQSLYRPADIEAHVAKIQQGLDQMTPVQLWDQWHSLDFEDGLGEWAEPVYAKYNKQSAILKNFAYGLLGLAGVGLVTMLSSLAMKQ